MQISCVMEDRSIGVVGGSGNNGKVYRGPDPDPEAEGRRIGAASATVVVTPTGQQHNNDFPQTTTTVRRSGMKRSSSENATNLGREGGEHLVYTAEPNVTKPWKQRFSFRQPRREQARSLTHLYFLEILSIYSSMFLTGW